MIIKIFYSWQSDTNKKYNFNFIQDALEKAIKLVKKDPRFLFDEILIDRDTQGVPGSPFIPATLDKKIEECQIFLADLTITNSAAIEFIKNSGAEISLKRMRPVKQP